ncbi:MAG TPA: 30S ribosomal protein S12 methylthiotransferase RimO, partial [Actinobacteria bacterium]|nr:30S ribosomal protein S12 methylthiotransferase RimO [Actinomycetota bacterium]
MSRPTVALVTLGCARNEVDSEELAARLLAGGFDLVTGDQADGADAVVVNTCGFIEAAKKDSVDALLAAADLKDGEGAGPAVIAVGCMAERYGAELARELPEADAVLSFDDYAAISSIVREVISGERPEAHTPQDRRHLLPLAPVDRPAKAEVARQRLDVSPVANLKLASGCDRRCSFCAIPSFRGAFTSRRPGEVLGEARWLAEGGAREIVLVSENSTSYGKDLGEHRALEALIPQLGQVESLQRLRITYLQPAEMRP